MKYSVLSALSLIVISSSAIAEGDVAKGESVFRKCASCHSNEEGKRKLGPSLFGVVGREAGSVEGYRYSSAMAEADFTWDEESLTAFLENPKQFVPGTKMAFAGIKKEEDMQNLLVYLDTLQ